MSYLEVIGRNIIDKDSLNREVGELGSTITRYVSFLDKLKLDDVYLKLESRSISGDVLIWGHEIYGVWGDGKWGSTPNVSFVLGKDGAGVLGQNYLGSRVSEWQVVATVSNPE